MTPEVPSPPRTNASAPLDLVSIFIVVTGICIGWAVFVARLAEGSMRHDFLSLYVGAAIAKDGEFAHLYEPSVVRERERALVQFSHAPPPYIRPPLYALLMSPLAALPLPAAYWVFITAQVGLLIGCWVWGARFFGRHAAIWGAMSLPAALAVAHGQDAPVYLAIAVGGFALSSKGHSFRAGLVWSLGLVKFNLFYLLPFGLLLGRKWKTLAGFLIGTVGFIAANLLIAPPGPYLSALRDRMASDYDMARLLNVNGICFNLGLRSPWVKGAIVLMVASFFLAVAWRAPLWAAWLSSILAGILLSPHVYLYDATILLLGTWLCIDQADRPVTRNVAMLFAIPLIPNTTTMGKPWAVITPIFLALWLASLAYERCGPLISLPPLIRKLKARGVRPA